MTAGPGRAPARPDAELIGSWRAALDHWEARAEGATSSVTGGGAVRVLETELSERLSRRPCLAVASGTVALAAALIGVGVRPGDAVLTAALDWPAAVEAIRLVRAVPVLVDVDPGTATLSPATVAAGLATHSGSTVGAVVVTHLFGTPADVPGIRGVLPDDVPLIEDCAQAIGARWAERPVGELGTASAFSFGPGKHVDAGEGGLVAFADEAAWDRAVVATQHRVRTLTSTRPQVSARIPGRMHPMAAVLALHGLAGLDEQLGCRHEQASHWLSEHPGAALACPPPAWPALWRVPVRDAVGSADTTLLPLPAPPGRFPGAHRAVAELRLALLAGGIGSALEPELPGPPGHERN